MTEVIETFDTTPIVEQPSIKLKTAGFWMRFWAFLLDSLVISAIVGIAIQPLFSVMNWDLVGNTWYAPITILSGLIFYAYFVLMTKFFKQTLGKMVFGMKASSFFEPSIESQYFSKIISSSSSPRMMYLYGDY